jgi:hypothetical protein
MAYDIKVNGAVRNVDVDGEIGTSPSRHHGPDAVAVTVETDAAGDIHPAVYVRRAGRLGEHLLPSDPLLDFATAEHRAALTGALGGLVG